MMKALEARYKAQADALDRTAKKHGGTTKVPAGFEADALVFDDEWSDAKLRALGFVVG